MGRGDRLRRPGLRAGARVLHRQRRLLDRRISPRRAAAGRDAADLRRLAGAHPRRRSAARRARPRGRASTFVIAENEAQDARLVRPPEQGGYGLDALWNDDFHHSAHGRADRPAARPTTRDYRGTPQEFVSARKIRLPVSGPEYRWQKQRAARRRSTCRRPGSSSTSKTTTRSPIPAPARAATTYQSRPLAGDDRLLLLAPATPMLFQGQEFGASNPFLYFADHARRAGARSPEGRRKNSSRNSPASRPRDAGAARRPDRYRNLPPL